MDSDERGYAVFNPQGLPLADLPVIYGFHNGGNGDWLHAQLIGSDGVPLGDHLCSHEAWMPLDLGVRAGRRSDRHEHFQKHFPSGYRMEFVSYDEVKAHEGLQAALKVYEETKPPSDDEGQTAIVRVEVSE